MSAFGQAQQGITAEISATMAAIDAADVDTLLKEVRMADRVYFVGVGRVLLSLQAIAKRLAHFGVDTVVVGQITEPAITDRDVLIVGSGSGESAIPIAIAARAKQHGARVVHIGSNSQSSMRDYADHFVRIPVQTKLNLAHEIPSIQPMTSLFEQCLLLLGDTVALMIVREDKLDMPSLWRNHANLE
ncbi:MULTISPECIES: 6-phospho-3-hexuloisomerase [Cryobacterium]|uniref:6-phospho-3-hexuloisomerase n=1 Tax=Cryobacterium TaxID=69578 RepID=UPI000CD46C9D|nr:MULTISPECIES: 6-phospho-3-hexuloisomerase [Cryobacterium]POH66042.1 sugar isomerase [Cryobacterium zongtaii]TFC46710.1 SIS domain-containing protein [Cryobacterium sp. TMN-39-2]